MCARYLVRKGSAWTFQIRLPSDLSSDSTLSRIRIPIGAMTPLEARREALLMAAAAEIVFRKVRVMSKGELFSTVANGRIVDIKNNKSPDHELVRTYAKVRDEFIALRGDRRVGEYRRKDLQHYVDEISWLPPTASSQKGFTYEDAARYIDANRSAGKRGLAVKTIREGRVAFIKAVIALGCEDADIRNPVAKCRISIPDRALLPPVAFEQQQQNMNTEGV